MDTHKLLRGNYIKPLFQSKHLGLTEKWTEINRKYADANVVLGEIPKVTLLSKVVEYLAQFMISQDMSLEDVSNKSDDLEFLESVLQYPRGEIGAPPRGYPKPLRSNILKSHNLDPVKGHPRDK